MGYSRFSPWRISFLRTVADGRQVLFVDLVQLGVHGVVQLLQPGGQLAFYGLQTGKLGSRFLKLFFQDLLHNKRIPVFKKGFDFIQGHVQVTQVFDGVHAFKLSCRIVTVAGFGVYNLRLEKPDIIIITQGTDIGTEQSAHFTYGKEVFYIHFITSVQTVSNTPHKTMTRMGSIFFLRSRDYCNDKPYDCTGWKRCLSGIPRCRL